MQDDLREVGTARANLKLVRRQTLAESAAAQGGTKVSVLRKRAQDQGWGRLGLILPFWASPQAHKIGAALKIKGAEINGPYNFVSKLKFKSSEEFIFYYIQGIKVISNYPN